MPGLETECQGERSKTIARWFAIAILTPLLYLNGGFGGSEGPALWWLAVLAGGMSAANLAHTLYLFRAQECVAWYKYVTVALDLVALTAAVRLTGGSASPFFFLYFLVLISNCVRHGLVMSLYIAAMVNVLYVLVLASVSPKTSPGLLQGEGLKILTFWAVAVYGGAISARLRRQAFELSTYEETIADLRSRLDAAEKREARDGRA